MRVRASFRPCTPSLAGAREIFRECYARSIRHTVYRSGQTVLHSFPSKTEKNSDADSVYRIYLRLLEVLFHTMFPFQLRMVKNTKTWKNNKLHCVFLYSIIDFIQFSSLFFNF